MKKRILFVILPFYVKSGDGSNDLYPTMPYGVLSIATFIKSCADIMVFDCNLYSNYPDVLKDRLKSYAPSVVGFSMMFDSSYSFLQSLIDLARAYDPSMKILLGGVAVTYTYKDILASVVGIDAVCYGDGELPMLDYLTTAKFNDSWATATNLSPKKALLTTLDSVIGVDYSFVNISDYQKAIIENYDPVTCNRNENSVQLYCMSSRGCVFSCTFCTNSSNDIRKIRYASVDSIIRHVESMIDKYGLNILSFIDDQILHNRSRAKELFRRLEPYGLTIKIPGGFTPLFVDEELVDLMWNAGLNSATLALESGSKEVLRIMRKPVKLNQVRLVVKWLRKYNFFIRLNLVIGMPGETDKHRAETVNYINEVKPDVISPSIASPVYGSKLREECIKRGYITDTKIGTYDRKSAVINTPEYTAEYVFNQAMYMMRKINFVNNYRMQIGDYETAKSYFEYVSEIYPEEAFAWYYLNKAREKLGEKQTWDEFNSCIENNQVWVDRFSDFGISIRELK